MKLESSDKANRSNRAIRAIALTAPVFVLLITRILDISTYKNNSHMLKSNINFEV